MTPRATTNFDKLHTGPKKRGCDFTLAHFGFIMTVQEGKDVQITSGQDEIVHFLRQR